ncbi:peptide ABC transporter substrate-binding protein [Virgibacillus sp. FSP13]
MVSKKMGWFILHIMVLTGIVLSACSNETGNESQSNNDTQSESGDPELADSQVLNLYAKTDFTSLDSAHASDAPSFDALYQISSGLIGFSKDGNFVPDLAADEPKVNEDKTVYTFTLRDGIKWSNGEPITAEDFVYAWQREVNPDIAGEYAFIFSSANIKNATKIMNKDSDIFGQVEKLGIEAIDQQTVKITLEKPTPYFVSLLSFPPFYPLNEEFVEGQGSEYATEVDKILYSGPFKMTEWNHGEGWVYEKNENYWDAENVTLEKVNYKVVENTSTLVSLFQSGELDYVEVDAQYITQFKGSEELHTGELTSDMKFLRLNQANEALENENIRDAIYNGFDREVLVNSLLQDGSASARYIVPKDWAMDSEGNDFRSKYQNINNLSLEEAEKSFQKGLEEIGKNSVTLDIMIHEGDMTEKVATFLQSQLEENLPGLKININKQPYGQHLKLEGERKYDISQWGWLPDYLDPITYLDIWLTDGPFNRTGFSNSEYDGLIDKANNLGLKPKERWKTLQEAEKMLLEDASIVPLYQSARAYVKKQYVTDLIPRNYGPTVDFRYAHIVNH